VAHSKLTPQVIEILCNEVRAGIKPTRAVQCAGFSRNCWSNWKRQAEAGDEPYAEAVDAIERSEALFLSDCEKRLGSAGKLDWKADMAVLEKRLRPEYGNKIDVTTRTAEVAELSREELLAIAYGKADDADAG
jgi:hypothetical protein